MSVVFAKIKRIAQKTKKLSFILFELIPKWVSSTTKTNLLTSTPILHYKTSKLGYS